MGLVKKCVRFVFVFLCFFLETACNASAPSEKSFQSISSAFKQEMRAEWNLACEASGCSWPDKLRSMSFSFLCYEPMHIREARVLEVRCTERLLEMLRKNQEIQAVLASRPFTGVEISIAFVQKDNTYFPVEDSISYVSNIKGVIYYDNWSFPEKKWVQILKEPYAEALEKVRAENGD